MDAARPSGHLPLVSAILPWWTRDILLLVHNNPSAVDAFIAAVPPLPAPDPLGAWWLHDDQRTQVLARRKLSGRPSRRLMLHRACISRLLRRAAALPAHMRSERLSELCFAQLLALLDQLNLVREWPKMPALLDLADQLGFDQPSQRQHLACYRGIAAVRQEQYKAGRQILKLLLGEPNLPERVRMLAYNALGAAAYKQSEYQQAADAFQQVAALALALKDREYEGTALLNNGIVQNELEHYEEALALTRQSLAIFQDLNLPHRTAHATYEIGNCALQLGRWAEAEAAFDRADEGWRAVGSVHGQAQVQWARGLLRHVLGDLKASQDDYANSLRLAQAYGDSDLQMDLHRHLGLLRQSSGDLDGALEQYQQALTLAEKCKNRHAQAQILYRIGTVREQLALREAAQDDHARANELRDAAAADYAHAIRLLEPLRTALDSTDLKIGLLGTTAQIYEAMVRLCLTLGRPREAFAYAERARSRAFLDLLARRARRTKRGKQGRRPTVTAAEVQAALPPDAALLAYFTIGVLPREERLIGMLPKHNEALRRLLTHPPEALIFALSKRELLVQQTELDPNRLQPHAGDPSPIARKLRAGAPERLYRELIAPVAPLCEGRAVLYLVPHGPLHYVPFAALRAPDGVCLLERSALALAPSATVLLRVCWAPPRPGRTALALGYNDPARRIVCAESEARLVAHLTGGAALDGPAPKTARLLEQAPELAWLHIAGHADLDAADPMATALVIGADETLTGHDLIERLRLRGAHVTVSACTSGLSRILPGDEQFGIPRALLHAGAASVLSTLWEAEDCVALCLMERFYQAVRAGRSPVQALREAQLAVRQMRPQDVAALLDRLADLDPGLPQALREAADGHEQHPFADPAHWAPFVIVGRA